MTMTTRWWWVRHAPVINPEGMIYGQLDLDADFNDREQVKSLAAILPGDGVWLTTTLRRARETAARLSAQVPPQRRITEDDDLREQSFGDWEGASWDDVPAAMRESYWADPVANRAPGGESFADVAARVAGAVAKTNTEFGGRDIVAVAHAGSIRAALSLALGGEPRAALSFSLAPLSLTRIDAVHQNTTTTWRISGVNLSGDSI